MAMLATGPSLRSPTASFSPAELRHLRRNLSRETGQLVRLLQGFLPPCLLLAFTSPLQLSEGPSSKPTARPARHNHQSTPYTGSHDDNTHTRNLRTPDRLMSASRGTPKPLSLLSSTDEHQVEKTVMRTEHSRQHVHPSPISYLNRSRECVGRARLECVRLRLPIAHTAEPHRGSSPTAPMCIHPRQQPPTQPTKTVELPSSASAAPLTEDFSNPPCTRAHLPENILDHEVRPDSLPAYKPSPPMRAVWAAPLTMLFPTLATRRFHRLPPR